jgi:hypothetical protein
MTDLEWLEQQFDRCWPFLVRAVRKMKEPYGREYVWERIAAGTAQLWPGNNCAVVTSIEVRVDGSKIIEGWLAAGDRAEIEEITEWAEAFGKREGCFKARLIQRPGFKAKPLSGYRLAAVVMEKVL